LKNDDFQSYGAPILKKFRRDLVLLVLAGCAAVITLYLSGTISENSLVIAYSVATFGAIFLLFKYLRQTWKLRDRRTVSRLATPLKPRRLRDFTSLPIEIAILLSSIAPFTILFYYYPLLPDVVPIHWNAAGEADGFAEKSFVSVHFMPILAAFLQIFWIVLKQDIIQARFRVPAEQAEEILSFKEISLQGNVGLIDWCRLIGGVTFSTVSLMILSPIVSPLIASGINVSTWILLVLLLTGLGFYMYRIILANREIKALAGQVTFQTDHEMQGWVDGLIYYNPQDSAFMVEKPGGVGYTINFARRRALLYAVLFVSPLLFVFIDLMLIKVK